MSKQKADTKEQERHYLNEWLRYYEKLLAEYKGSESLYPREVAEINLKIENINRKLEALSRD